MSAKSNKIELSEEFMVMLREEQTLVLLEILQIHGKTPVPEHLF